MKTSLIIIVLVVVKFFSTVTISISIFPILLSRSRSMSRICAQLYATIEDVKGETNKPIIDGVLIDVIVELSPLCLLC